MNDNIVGVVQHPRPLGSNAMTSGDLLSRPPSAAVSY
jgi:hypothetical protein